MHLVWAQFASWQQEVNHSRFEMDARTTDHSKKKKQPMWIFQVSDIRRATGKAVIIWLKTVWEPLTLEASFCLDLGVGIIPISILNHGILNLLLVQKAFGAQALVTQRLRYATLTRCAAFLASIALMFSIFLTDRQDIKSHKWMNWKYDLLWCISPPDWEAFAVMQKVGVSNFIFWHASCSWRWFLFGRKRPRRLDSVDLSTFWSDKEIDLWLLTNPERVFAPKVEIGTRISSHQKPVFLCVLKQDSWTGCFFDADWYCFHILQVWHSVCISWQIVSNFTNIVSEIKDSSGIFFCEIGKIGLNETIEHFIFFDESRLCSCKLCGFCKLCANKDGILVPTSVYSFFPGWRMPETEIKNPCVFLELEIAHVWHSTRARWYHLQQRQVENLK